MKLKSTYKFINSECITPMIIFYIVVFLILLLVIVVSNATNSVGSVSGLDSTSIIFLFIMGIVMFKTPFHFFSANSVSRKTMLISTLLTALTMSGIMFLADTLNAIILKSINVFSEKYVTLFEASFGLKLEGINILKYILFGVMSYLLCFAIGYFIGAINYRLPQKIKIALIIGIIVFFTMGLPFLVGFLGKANTPVLDDIAEFIKTNIFGSTNGFIITELVLTIVFALVSYRVAIRANLNAK